MKNRRKIKKNNLLWQYLVGSALLLTILTFSLLYIIKLSMDPLRSSRSEAIALARKYTKIKKVDSFAIYNGKNSYYSLLGQDKNSKSWAVLIEKDSDKIYVYQLSKGISQKEAEKIAQENGAEKIDKTTFGYLDGQPVWEVKSGTAYYNISWKKKTLLSKEGL